MHMPYTTITATSTGYTGAPGWHRFKFMGALTAGEASTCAAAMKTFYSAITTRIPGIVKMSWQQPAQVFSDAGVLTSEVTIGTLPSQVTFTGTGAYAGGVGAVVYWNTPGINGGHKVRGRTYLVPLSAACFDVDGTLVSSALSEIVAAAAALVATTPGLAVNSRAEGAPGRSNQTTLVTSATVADRVAVLRSRRG